MKYFFKELFEKIKQFSHEVDKMALLKGQHWVVMNEIEEVKKVLIFRENNELIVSSNGKVDVCKWEYLGYNSILLGINGEHFLYKNEFFDEDVLALKLDSQETPFLLLNETKYGKEINSIETVLKFLSTKYIKESKQFKESEYYKPIVNINYADERYLDPINRLKAVIEKDDLQKLFPYIYEYPRLGVVVYQYVDKEEAVCCGDRVFDLEGKPFNGKLKFGWLNSYYIKDGIIRG